MLSKILGFCAVLCAIVGTAVPATAQDQPTVVINLTSDDVWTGQMALGFARGLLADGGDVVVFLNVRAVTLANANVPQHTEAATGLTAHEMLTEIMAAGGRVFLCGGCTRQAGLSMEDRIDGIQPSGPEFRSIVMAPDTRILSY